MDNPWLRRRILNFAHQGGAAEAPSSTLFALDRAKEIGAHALELDVHRTRDGHLVVCHDATVDATTNGHGRIADMSLEELRALDNAYHFAPEDKPEQRPYRGRAQTESNFRVATLEEVLERYRSIFLNLDIKQTAPDVVPYEHQLADLLRRFGRTNDVIVASFLDAATDAFSAYAPEFCTSVGTENALLVWQAVQSDEPLPKLRHQALQVPADFQGIPVVDARFVQRAHEADLAVHIWTVNERAEMIRLLDLGVDGLITDKPSVLASLLRERGGAFTSAK